MHIQTFCESTNCSHSGSKHQLGVSCNESGDVRVLTLTQHMAWHAGELHTAVFELTLEPSEVATFLHHEPLHVSATNQNLVIVFAHLVAGGLSLLPGGAAPKS